MESHKSTANASRNTIPETYLYVTIHVSFQELSNLNLSDCKHSHQPIGNSLERILIGCQVCHTIKTDLTENDELLNCTILLPDIQSLTKSTDMNELLDIWNIS